MPSFRLKDINRVLKISDVEDRCAENKIFVMRVKIYNNRKESNRQPAVTSIELCKLVRAVNEYQDETADSFLFWAINTEAEIRELYFNNLEVKIPSRSICGPVGLTSEVLFAMRVEDTTDDVVAIDIGTCSGLTKRGMHASSNRCIMYFEAYLDAAKVKSLMMDLLDHAGLRVMKNTFRLPLIVAQYLIERVFKAIDKIVYQSNPLMFDLFRMIAQHDSNIMKLLPRIRVRSPKRDIRLSSEETIDDHI